MKADKPWLATTTKPVFHSTRARAAYQRKVNQSAGGQDPKRSGRVPTGAPFRIDPDTGCWLWRGDVTAQGYGWVNGQLAHRVVYRYYKGPIESGYVLLHQCDTPACINPDHLEPGTQAENMADMHAKGRARPWGKEPKLTADQRVDVIIRYLDGESASALAAEYGVTAGYVSSMAGPRNAGGGSRSKLTENQRAEVAKAYRAGEPAQDIMDRFGISRSLLATIHRDLNGGEGRPLPPAPTHDVQRMLELRAQGWTHQRIADECGCSKTTVGRLLSEHSKPSG